MYHPKPSQPLHPTWVGNSSSSRTARLFHRSAPECISLVLGGVRVMRFQTTIIGLALLVIVAATGCSPPAQTQTPAGNGKTSVLKIVSTESQRANGRAYTHEIFLDDRRFASLAELQRHLAESARGTRIEYDFSCLALLDRPLAHYDDLEAFQRFCTNRGIDLALLHSAHTGRVVWLPQTP